MTGELQRPRRPLWRWFLVAVGPVVLVILFSSVGVEEIAIALGAAERRLVALAFTLAVPALLVRSWRWRLLLGRDGERMGYGEVTAVFAHAVFVGTATPGRLGEFVKVFQLRERGVPTGRALASVLLDRMLDVAMLLVMATGGLALLVGGNDVLVGVGAILLFLLLVWLSRALVCGAPAEVLAGVLRPLAGQRFRDKVAELRAGLCGALDELQYRALLGGTALTTVAWGINYYANFQLAQALGLPLSYFDVAGISAVASLVVLLPVSVAGAGTRDVAMVGLLAVYGIDQAEAVALSSMFLLFILWNAVMCGAWSLAHRLALKEATPKGNAQVRRDSRRQSVS